MPYWNLYELCDCIIACLEVTKLYKWDMIWKLLNWFLSHKKLHYFYFIDFYICNFVLSLIWQHESATRTVDDNVWVEFRNFKKCLIMMFAKQEKEVVFLETVMGLAQQRRHCMVECIPLPQDIAKEAPLYFKKVRCQTLLYFVVLHCSSLSTESML